MKRFLIASLCIASLHTSVSAQGLIKPWWFHPLISATGGIATSQFQSSKTFIVNDSTYRYHSKGSSDEWLWGGFIGTEIPLNCWAFDIGIGYYQPSSFTNHGNLVQGIDPQSSDQYQYDFKVKTQQLLGEGKLSWQGLGYLFPYISGGLGASWNKAYAYQVNFPRFLTFSPLYANHTQTSFSYNVGLGADIPLNRCARVGIGYRFSDFGRAKLGQGMIDTTPVSHTLSTSPIYSNEAVAQLTLLA